MDITVVGQWIACICVEIQKINPDYNDESKTKLKIFCEYDAPMKEYPKMQPTRHLFQSSEINFSESAECFY